MIRTMFATQQAAPAADARMRGVLASGFGPFCTTNAAQVTGAYTTDWSVEHLSTKRPARLLGSPPT